MAQENTLTERVKQTALDLGFDLAAVAPVVPGPHSHTLQSWLAAGHAAEMHYLARDPERRQDPRRVLPGARAVVVCAVNYYPGAEPAHGPNQGIVARYARGDDYHDVLLPRLERLREFLHAEAPPPAESRAYVDTGPVLEREAAALAGLGHIGKNTCLIHRRLGSYLLLGVLITTVELEPDAPTTGHLCGNCTRCLDACPTGALRAPFVLDSRRCLSYLTIEHRGAIADEHRDAVGNRVFGCDICQEVCPWNRRACAKASPPLAPRPESTAPDLSDLLRLDQAEFSRRFRGSPIKRAKRRGLLRSAAVALGNAGRPEAIPALVTALADPEPLVRAHAAWALGRIGTAAAYGALRRALETEQDADARAEIRRALPADGLTG